MKQSVARDLGVERALMAVGSRDVHGDRHHRRAPVEVADDARRRSCTSTPISCSGDDSLNDCARLGRNAWISAPSTSGRYDSPMPNIGCPNASTVEPSTYVTVPVPTMLMSPRTSSTPMAEPGSTWPGSALHAGRNVRAAARLHGHEAERSQLLGRRARPRCAA